MDLTADTSTLPVDFEGSLDPSRLPEITLGSHSLMAASEQRTPLGPKTCSDRLSPVRGRTMKEYDQQISDLKKENFSLKMRIYYMEERMQQRFGDGQDVFRTNIELQVDVENLKRELADKQMLVQKAALAMETLTAKHEQERELMRGRLQGDCKEEMNQLRHQLELANQKCQTSYRDVEKAEQKLEMLKLQLDDVQVELKDSRRANQELSAKVEHTEFEVQALSGQLTLADQAKTKCEKENLALTQKLKDLEEQLHSAHKGSARKDRDLLNLSAMLQDQSHVDCMPILEPFHYQDELEDLNSTVSKKDGQVADLEEKLNTKDGIIGDLEAAVKYLEKKYKDTEETLAQMEKEAERKETQLVRYKKTIASLLKSLHEKEGEGTELKKQLEQTGDEVSRLQDAVKVAEMQKAQALDSVASQLVEAHANCERLQHQLTDANETSENLVKSLGKKEGELTGFQEQLSKAIDALTTSEEAVEALHAQLKAERADFDNRLREQAVHFQISVNNKSEHGNELEGLRQQIVDLQKLIASQNVELLGLTRDRDVVADMRDRLKEKDAEIELLSTEHKRELSELERELQALRVALTGKDMQIETLEKHTAWLKEHQRDTVERMRETWSSLGGVNVQELSHNLLQDIKMLMDLLRQEITSLATLQLQLRDSEHSGHGISTEALSTEILSVQRIYRQLEEGVDKNSRLHQALLHSARGELRQSDSPDNNSCQDGGYNLGSSHHQAKPTSLSASPERRATQSLSPQHKSAKRGTAAVLSESMSSLESEWGPPPASHSLAVETCPELIDRSLQAGTSFCHTDQWVQTSPMIGAAVLSPGDRRLPAAGKEVLSVSVGLSPICKSRLFFDSDDDLRRHYAFGHHNDSLTDDAKEEHLGLYAENLEDYQNFQHGVFFDEHHLDSRRYDQGSALKSGSQQMPSSSRRATSPAVPTVDRSGRGGSVVARSMDKTGNLSSKYSSDNVCGNSLDLDEPDGSFDTSNGKSGHGVSAGVSDKPNCTDENCQSQMKVTHRHGPSSGGGISRDNSDLTHRIQDGDSDDGMLSKTAKTPVLSDVGKSGEGGLDTKGRTNAIEKHDENIVQEGEFGEKEKLECGRRGGESTETTVRVRSRRNSWAEELEKYRVQNSKKGLSSVEAEPHHGDEVCDQQLNHSRHRCSADPATLAAMSTSELKKLVEELQADLILSVTHNRQLQKQLETAGSSRLAERSWPDGEASTQLSLTSQDDHGEYVYIENHKSRIPRPCSGSNTQSLYSAGPVNTKATTSTFGVNVEHKQLLDLTGNHSVLNLGQSDVDRTKSTPSTRVVAEDTDGQLSSPLGQIKYLEEKLLASEKTVQLLSKKNQAYLSALEAAGVSMLQVNRSNSESCLDSNSRSCGRRTSSSGYLNSWISAGQYDGQDGNSQQISSSNCWNMTSRPGTVDSIEKARSYFPNACSESGNDSCYSLPTGIMATMSQSPDSTTRHLEDSVEPASPTVPPQNQTNPKFSLPVCINNLSQKTGPVEVTRVDHSTSAIETNTPSSLSMNLKVYPEASADLLQGNASPGRAGQSPRSRAGQSPGSRAGQSPDEYIGQRQASGQRSPWQAHTKQMIDASVLDHTGFPDVTYSSMLDNTIVNRLLTNLDQNMSALKEDSCNISSLNIEQLLLRVEHLERVNLTLREEIEVYEALHHSQGTQVSPSLGEEFAGEGYRHERKLTEEDLLKQHLIEIRKLRQRLERLDVTKDPDQLLIFQSHTQQRIARQETMISHLQQQMVEKEEQWQRDLAEMQHRMCREKAMLVEKLEMNVSDLQKMVKSQMVKIEEQDRQIVDLLTELNGKEEFERKKEDEIKRILSEKAELEADLLKRDQEFLDIEKKLFRLEMAKENSESECRRLYCEIEERDQDNDKMRKQIEEGRETSRCLKETVVKCEKSLQEKVVSLQKLTTDKAACDLRLAEKDGQIQKLEAELGDLRKQVDEMKVWAEETVGLRFEIDRLREELKKKESLEAKYEFQKVGYETEIERVTEENNQIRTQLESKIEEAVELRHRIDDSREKLQEKAALEDQMRLLNEKIRSLEDNIGSLKTELDSRSDVEVELRERLNTLCHAQSEVIVLKEKLVSAGDSLKLVEAAKTKLTEDLKEREEKVKKRDKQLHHLLGQYKKMDIAFTKQKYMLSEKLELVQSLKKQMHLYEVTLTCASQEDKDNIMKQLLKELIATQRQVEDLLSRLEHHSTVPKITSVFVDGFSMSSSSTTTTTTTTAGGSQHDLPDLATTVPARADTPERLLDDHNFSGVDLRQELRPYTALTQVSTNQMSPYRSVLSTQTSPNCSPRPLKYFAGSDCAVPEAGTIPQAMVGSDIRSLFAILKLDSHEKLRKETAESLVVLSGLEARLGSRLKLYKTKSVSESMDYSTLREASMSCQNLRVCLEEAKRLVATAWISELPPIDARGHFYDPVLVEQNEHLKRQLSRLSTHCDVVDYSLTDQQGQSLHTNTESASRTWENSLYKQLHKTSKDLEQAKENIDTSVQLTLPARYQTFSPQKPARRRLEDTL